MSKRRHTEEQIIGFLKQAKAGNSLVELCRHHGFSNGSFYAWNKKFDGMKVSEAKRLRSFLLWTALW